MKLPIALSLFLVILGLGWAGCGSKDENWLDKANCTGIDAANNTYNLSVKNILNVTCAISGCHDAATQSNGVNLSTYAGARAAFEDGAALCAINHGSDCEHMPKNGSKLSDATINTLACWAKNGYKE
ncbi:MAG: hypothetical protein IT260_03825 [Saprospiraceae bacterium]|nr:hypothetical protein [Saprospiraceae bacterium]